MSYILDALRKADAERERGAVPDLQSQWLPGSPGDDEPEPRPLARWLWPALGLGVVALGAAVWWYLGGSTATPPPAVPPVMPMPAPPVASIPAPASVPASAPAPTPALAAAVAEPPAPAKKPVAQTKSDKAEKEEAARARREAAAAARARKRAEAEAAAKAQREAAAASAAQAASAPAMLVLRLNELPEDLRRQVPTLTVGGSVYSPQPDKRMVIFNGQVFSEGAMLTPELKLEQIRKKSAVLSIRGQRFEMPL